MGNFIGKNETVLTTFNNLTYFALSIAGTALSCMAATSTLWSTDGLGLFAFNGQEIWPDCKIGEGPSEVLGCSQFNAVRGFALTAAVIFGLLVPITFWHLKYEAVRDPDKDIGPIFFFAAFSCGFCYYLFLDYLNSLSSAEKIGTAPGIMFEAFIVGLIGTAVGILSFAYKSYFYLEEDELE